MTNVLKYDIIVKLSREIPSQRRQRTLKIVSVAKGEAGTFSSLLKNLAGSDSFLKKTFSKNFKKVLDKPKTTWYNKQDVTESDSNESLRAKR